MNANVPDPVGDPHFDRERLIAFSSLLRTSSREIECYVRGASMGSVLPEGSRIHICFCPAETLMAGQVVTYIAKNRLVVHRLVRAATSTDNYLITRGDTTVLCDAPILTSSVIGVVTEFRNNGRWQPVGQPADRGRGSRFVASAICGMVVFLFRLSPAFSYWFTERLVEIRWVALRFVGLVKRCAIDHRPVKPMRVDEAATSPESDPQAPARANEVTPPTATLAHARANDASPRPPSDLNSAHPVAKYCSDFSPEHEFLLRLLGHGDSAQDVMLRRQSPQIEWMHLFTVIPPDLYAFVGHRLAQLGLESQCPALLWEQTVNHRRLIAAQWLRYRHELRRLIETFSRDNVDFLLLKGAVIAFAAYPDRSLRPMSDIDLLVRPESLDKALELTDAAGFRCPERYKFAHPVSFGSPRCRGQSEVSLPLQKSGTLALIEVHTELEMASPWFPVDISRLWESAEKTQVDGLWVRSLEKHEFLFHLVLHLARCHLFDQGLRPLLDVHLWVELHKHRMDWEWFAFETVNRGYGDWVHLTLKIVRDLFKTSIPARFFDRMSPPPEFERLQHLAHEQIWAERRVDRRVPGFLAVALSQPSAKTAFLLILKRVWPSWRGVNFEAVPPVEPLKDGGLVVGFRRSVTDWSEKLPRYFRAWREGILSCSNIQRAMRLARGSAEIAQILAGRKGLT